MEGPTPPGGSSFVFEGEGTLEVGTARKGGATEGADEEFDYAFAGGPRQAPTHKKEFKPQPVPAHLVTNVRSQGLTALGEDAEEGEEGEEEEETAHEAAGKVQGQGVSRASAAQPAPAVTTAPAGQTGISPASAGYIPNNNSTIALGAVTSLSTPEDLALGELVVETVSSGELLGEHDDLVRPNSPGLLGVSITSMSASGGSDSTPQEAGREKAAAVYKLLQEQQGVPAAGGQDAGHALPSPPSEAAAVQGAATGSSGHSPAGSALASNAHKEGVAAAGDAAPRTPSGVPQNPSGPSLLQLGLMELQQGAQRTPSKSQLGAMLQAPPAMLDLKPGSTTATTQSGHLLRLPQSAPGASPFLNPGACKDLGSQEVVSSNRLQKTSRSGGDPLSSLTGEAVLQDLPSLALLRAVSRDARSTASDHGPEAGRSQPLTDGSLPSSHQAGSYLSSAAYQPGSLPVVPSTATYWNPAYGSHKASELATYLRANNRVVGSAAFVRQVLPPVTGVPNSTGAIHTPPLGVLSKEEQDQARMAAAAGEAALRQLQSSSSLRSRVGMPLSSAASTGYTPVLLSSADQPGPRAAPPLEHFARTVLQQAYVAPSGTASAAASSPGMLATADAGSQGIQPVTSRDCSHDAWGPLQTLDALVPKRSVEGAQAVAAGASTPAMQQATPVAVVPDPQVVAVHAVPVVTPISAMADDATVESAAVNVSIDVQGLAARAAQSAELQPAVAAAAAAAPTPKARSVEAPKAAAAATPVVSSVEVPKAAATAAPATAVVPPEAPKAAAAAAAAVAPEGAAAALDEWDQANLERANEAAAATAAMAAGTVQQGAQGAQHESYAALLGRMQQEEKGSAEVWAAAEKQLQAGEKKGFLARLLCMARPAMPHALHEQKVQALVWAATPYSETQPLHWDLLASSYHALTGVAAAPARYGAHWQTLGWQGSDPATDLRGCGVLGLLQLASLADCYPRLAASLYKLSRSKQQGFPLAVVSLNMTKHTLQALRSGQLDPAISQEGAVWPVVARFHAGALATFQCTWTQGNKTMAQSGFVMKEIEEQCRRSPAAVLKEGAASA